MIKPLSILCMNDMRPLMKLISSFMWNLEPSGKVMNLEVKSRNCIFFVMNDGLRVGWLERHHIILRKVIRDIFIAIVRQP